MNRLLIPLCLCFTLLLQAQTGNPPVYNEPPFKANASDETLKSGESHLIPDSLAQTIVLAINQAVFPPRRIPKISYPPVGASTATIPKSWP